MKNMSAPRVYCGSLREENIGQRVSVCGWVARNRDLGALIFIDVRDREGIVQCVFDRSINDELAEKAFALRAEYTVRITGTVRMRSAINDKIPTGKIEIVADPTDASKKVFKVKCIDSSLERYTYLNLFMHFEPGETYTVKYKIMPLTDITGKEFAGTIIGGNLIYGTVSSGGVSNHTFDNASNKSTTDRWIEVTHTFTVSDAYSASGNDKFQIWGKFSPTTKKGIDYLVKDISITIED